MTDKQNYDHNNIIIEKINLCVILQRKKIRDYFVMLSMFWVR